MALRRLNGLHGIAAYILIETEAGIAATVAAALRDLPGVSEPAVLAGPYDVIARAQAHNIDELARLVTSQLQALDGVLRTMTSPVVHLRGTDQPWSTTSPFARRARAAPRRPARAAGAVLYPARTR